MFHPNLKVFLVIVYKKDRQLQFKLRTTEFETLLKSNRNMQFESHACIHFAEFEIIEVI